MQPANDYHVLTVGALNALEQPTGFTHQNHHVDLSAPGEDVLVPVPVWADVDDEAADGYARWDGTSFSAPMVAAAAAWVMARRPGLTADQVAEVLRRSARDVHRPGWDLSTGWGALDLRAALARPAPRHDLAEPNDDIRWVAGRAGFAADPPLLRRRAGQTIRARLDALKDPFDVYPLWLPARGSVDVRLAPGDVLADLYVWRPAARTAYGRGALAKSRRPGLATEVVRLTNEARSAAGSGSTSGSCPATTSRASTRSGRPVGRSVRARRRIVDPSRRPMGYGGAANRGRRSRRWPTLPRPRSRSSNGARSTWSGSASGPRTSRPPAIGESLYAWASHRGHGPLGALMSAVFDAGGRSRFPWERFGGASPFFEEPEGDFSECALVLVDGEPPEVGEPQVAQRAVVLRLDLDELRGPAGLSILIDRVEEALVALLSGACGRRRARVHSRPAARRAPPRPVVPGPRRAGPVRVAGSCEDPASPTGLRSGRRGSAMGRFMRGIGAFSAGRPLLVVVAWLLIAAGLALLVRGVGADTSNDLSLPGTDSQAATDLLAAAVPAAAERQQPAGLPRPTGVADGGPQQGEPRGGRQGPPQDARTSTRRPTRSRTPRPGLVSEDGAYAFIPVVLDIDAGQLDDATADAVLEARPARARRPALEVAIGGPIGGELSKSPTETSELIGIIAAMVILTFTFGTLVAMGMPIVTAIVALVVGARRRSACSGHLITIPTVGPTLATMIGLGVGIDYSLFLVTRHREPRREGMDVRESIARRWRPRAAPIVFAGGTVVIALLSLQVAGIPFVTRARLRLRDRRRLTAVSPR